MEPRLDVLAASEAAERTARELVVIRQLLEGRARPHLRYAAIDVDAAGDNEIVANPRAAIVVVSYVLIAGGQVEVRWRSGSRDLSGPMALDARGGLAIPHEREGLFATSPSQALNLNLSAAVAVGGHLAYYERR